MFTKLLRVVVASWVGLVTVSVLSTVDRTVPWGEFGMLLVERMLDSSIFGMVLVVESFKVVEDVDMVDASFSPAVVEVTVVVVRVEGELELAGDNVPSVSASVIMEWIVVVVKNVLDVTTVLSPSSFDELVITELDWAVVGTEGIVVSLASTGIVWTVVVSISEDDGVGPRDLPPPM